MSHNDPSSRVARPANVADELGEFLKDLLPKRRPIGEVTEQALFARIKRRLAHDLEYLKTCTEGSRYFHDLGRYYAANEHSHLTRTHIDLEGLGRELGALAAHERVVSAEAS